MNAPPVPKPPRDPLPWIYWGIFFIAVPLVALWMANKPVPQAIIPVLTHDVSAYSVIAASDVMTKAVGLDEVTADTVQDASNLIGHYTREMLRAGLPITTGQVGAISDPGLISNTFAVAVPANTATTLGGDLQAGDVVSMAAVPISNTASVPTIVFDTMLVLDVKSAEDEKVVILAVPVDRWLEYLTKTRNAVLVLARQVE
jgi:hypothetical protein